MSKRCPNCGTYGTTNSSEQFVSDDWLRASKYKQQRDKLLEALKEVMGYWSSDHFNQDKFDLAKSVIAGTAGDGL